MIYCKQGFRTNAISADGRERLKAIRSKSTKKGSQFRVIFCPKEAVREIIEVGTVFAESGSNFSI